MPSGLPATSILEMYMKFSTTRLSLVAGAALVILSGTSHAASLLGQAPGPSLIVAAGGYEWVYANPCAGESPTCSDVVLSHGFEFATDAQWTTSFASISDLVTAFSNNDGSAKCASPYFSVNYDHCDLGDAQAGYIWHSPLAPDAAHADNPNGETFLVRDSVGAVPEPSSYALMLVGMATVAGVLRRRRNAA